jgi:hypothetical protein
MSTITTVRCASSCASGILADTILDRMDASALARRNGRLEAVLINGAYCHMGGLRKGGNACFPLAVDCWCDHARAVLIMMGERTLFAGCAGEWGELFRRFQGDNLPGTVFIADYKLYEAGWDGDRFEWPSRRLYI